MSGQIVLDRYCNMVRKPKSEEPLPEEEESPVLVAKAEFAPPSKVQYNPHGAVVRSEKYGCAGCGKNISYS